MSDTSPERDDRRLYSLVEAARVLSITRSTLYHHLDSGGLRSVRLGGRRLVAAQDLDAFVDELRREAGLEAEAS